MSSLSMLDTHTNTKAVISVQVSKTIPMVTGGHQRSQHPEKIRVGFLSCFQQIIFTYKKKLMISSLQKNQQKRIGSKVVNLDQMRSQSCDLSEPYKRQRSILVFHCEFSSERAPRQLRYLRACDRTRNPYPRLHYPEIYLLKGGYKEFYHTYKELCVPEEYLPMLDERYNKEYKLFRTGYLEQKSVNPSDSAQ